MRFVALALLVPGCFYIDPINQRPSADIVQASSGTVYRGDVLQLDASKYDPEGGQVYPQWRAYACTDATMISGCDEVPFYTDILDHADILVPIMRIDGTTPVQALRVILEATDDRGATMKPSQELLLAVSDRPPDVTLRKDTRHGYVVQTPIDIYAKVDDKDDTAARVTVKPWEVFSPASQPTFTLVDQGPLATDPTQDWQIFTPNGIGDWDIKVTAVDPQGAETIQHMPITVVDDHAPCLSQWSPAAPPPGNVLPMQDPTPFEVLVVQDDLDPYPPVPGDAELGQTQFTWTLLPPGATQRQTLSTVGNRVEIDPASYRPGDQLELRVEIKDRKNPAPACPDTDPTCSVISDPTCVQRLTWRVEVR